ncbi:alpha/beta hydrolase [Synechococcus sp. M16CYN]
MATWLRLLDTESRKELISLFNAPVLTRRSLGQQLLNSWGAGPLIDALGSLIRVEGGGRISSSVVLPTLERLLLKQAQVSTLDVLQALPAQHLRLDLNALIDTANHWFKQLERHNGLMAALAAKPITHNGKPNPLSASFSGVPQSKASPWKEPQKLDLAVLHREGPIQLQIWSSSVFPSSPKRPWLLLMPGLGGSPEHFDWLAGTLAEASWVVVVVKHPGSDAAAVRAFLDGQQSFDGAKALRQRLADLNSVLEEQRKGQIPVEGTNVVLIGYSFGALTALLAAGASPVSGIDHRCRQSLAAIPVTNLSELLQCELADSRALKISPIYPQPIAVVGLNSFGGLIWPNYHQTQPLNIPLLLIGGTLDLITPPLDEQIALLSGLGHHPLSQAIVVEGASHFSPIRVGNQSESFRGNDLFQLNENLVGVNPLVVQKLIAMEMINFLEQLDSNVTAASVGHFNLGSIRWHRLNRNAAKRLIRNF